MSDFPKLSRIKSDDENMEKIHCAARRGQTELVRRLIASGIDPAIHNKFGCTALHLACKHGQIGCTRELSTKVDLSGLWHGQRPLHLAVASKSAEVVALLVEAAKAQGRDVAAFIGECDEYETFEMNGIAKHCSGQTALHGCVTARQMGMAKTLVALGASPTAKDKNGETPMGRAIEFDFQEEFDLLVSIEGLRIETYDRAGRTALHHCLSKQREAMAAKLLDLGHEVNMEDQDKVTPWLLAGFAGMTGLLDRMLHDADPFAIQTANFHNGQHVLPERLLFMPHVSDEAVKTEVIKILQKKLDSIVKNAPNSAATTTKKHVPGAAAPAITLAPSAPVKK
jgi:hypothetical protein